MRGWLKALLIVAAIAVLLIVAVIGLLISAASYGWKAALRAGNEAATMQDLKTIAAVEIQYYNTHNRTFGTFDQMVNERMLSSKFSGDPPITDGYLFTMTLIPGGTSKMSVFILKADPRDESAGRNHFYLDSNSAGIHVSQDRAARADDQLIK
jgi:Tfp pilus assembly protein PilE